MAGCCHGPPRPHYSPPEGQALRLLYIRTDMDNCLRMLYFTMLNCYPWFYVAWVSKCIHKSTAVQPLVSILQTEMHGPQLVQECIAVWGTTKLYLWHYLATGCATFFLPIHTLIIFLSFSLQEKKTQYKHHNSTTWDVKLSWQ
jgi:hypothetical protein